MAIPTQRPPFFASFFGAFRARTSPTFQAKSSNPSTTLPSSIAAAAAAAAHVSTTTANGATTTPNTSVTSRSITTSSSTDLSTSQLHPSTTSALVSHAQSIPTSASANKPSPSPFSSSAFASAATASPHSPFYGPRSPGTASPTHHSQAIPLTRGRQRRGSDSSSSSGGFMDALGGNEKWYIGGRTATGEERFYRLGLVTSGGAGHGRATSLDRLSL